ncbi:MAG: hypothetical protein ABEJ83_04615 [Candidatus Nanohaloarchaea archaeon]
MEEDDEWVHPEDRGYDQDKPWLPQQSAAYQFKHWERKAQNEKSVTLADWNESSSE